MAKVDISVRELVDKVSRGELALPEMQRRYVWTGTRVRDLLDSLYRGYPSGTILVWETDDNVETRELAVRATRTPTTSQKLLLLDGQQRVTSLSAIVSGEPVHVRGRKRPIDILFNLEHPDGPPTDVTEVDEEFTADLEDVETEEEAERDIQEELRQRTFVVANRVLQHDPLWIPVSRIFKESDAQILRGLGVPLDDARWDKYAERIQKVKNIANYMYVMQVLEKNMSYEEVTEIFVRVNSLGIKLRGSDLALAQITSRWPGFMEKIEAFASQFGDNADYVVESGLAVRAMVIFATNQSRFKTVGRISRTELEVAWDKAVKGLGYAINFLRSNAHIDDLHHLSSPFLLLPIAVYWIEQGGTALQRDDEQKLLKWFYYAHMRGHYSMGSSESILDADLAILFRQKDLNELVAQLSLHVKKLMVDEYDIAGKGIRSPFFSMLYFVLKQNGAKDWLSGLMLSERHAGNAHKLQYHHIFPKSLLKELHEKREINEMANMAFIGGKTNRHILNREPSRYLPEEIIAKRGEDTLTSQLVPIDPKLWEMGSYPAFLAYRRKAIADAINAFMAKLG